MKARKVIEIQGNLSALLEQMLGIREREREHRAMIERTVEELTPIIGTRPACRARGRVCGDDLPSSPPAAAQASDPAAADTGQGAV